MRQQLFLFYLRRTLTMATLENNLLKVIIDENRSMKIDSFIDKKNNKNWVWKPEKLPDNPQRDLDLKADFDSNWTGGWEEVFPNDAPCEFDDFKLVDHGEVWRKRWKKIKQDEFSVTAVFQCETMPFQLEKTITLDSNGASLILDYKIKNNSSRSLPYIFKFHPALCIEEGDRFILPPSKMRPVALPFSRLLGDADEMNFPVGKNPQGKVVNIEKVLHNDNYSREFVKISDLKSGECSLFNPKTKTELKFEFSMDDLPYV